MEKEKIKQIYQKFDIIVSEDVIESVLQDKEKTKGMMKIYKDEEIESMNYIFGKDRNNKYFTEFELQAVSKIDLFNRKVLEICKNIWKREFKEVNV